MQKQDERDTILSGLEAAFGKSSTYINLVADSDGTSEYYVTQDDDGNWVETQSAVDYTETDVPYWTPIFLDKGELTFDASGTLISPVGGAALASADITGGDIDLSYKGTTQYGSPFAINSRIQNGAPEGDLVDINVSNDGLVACWSAQSSQNVRFSCLTEKALTWSLCVPSVNSTASCRSEKTKSCSKLVHSSGKPT